MVMKIRAEVPTLQMPFSWLIIPPVPPPVACGSFRRIWIMSDHKEDKIIKIYKYNIIKNIR